MMDGPDIVLLGLFAVMGLPFIILAIGSAIEGILTAYVSCLERLNRLEKGGRK